MARLESLKVLSLNQARAIYESMSTRLDMPLDPPQICILPQNCPPRAVLNLDSGSFSVAGQDGNRATHLLAARVGWTTASFQVAKSPLSAAGVLGWAIICSQSYS